MSEPTLYDVYPYRARSYVESHVDMLHVVARLFGLDVAPVESCRVLEIGCADGGNLIPMAEVLPGSTFVGLDLAKTQVEDGMSWIEPLGMTNIELVHCGFDALPASYGEFDYIICHGVYSWIPPELQVPLLEMLRARLTPNGVAYVSYNTFPGWHTRRGIRDFLLQHADPTDTPQEQVERAMMHLRFLHDAMDPDSNHGRIIRSQCQQLLGSPPQYLVHGLLAEHNHPLYFKDFVRQVETAGLQYLGDAEFGSMMPDRLHRNGQSAMDNVPGGLVEREIVQDQIVNRAFRRSLVCHADRELQRSIPWETVEAFWLSARARLLEGSIDETGMARFDAPEHTFSTDNPVLKAGLAELARVWPDNIAFSDWVARVAERTGHNGIEVRSTLGRNVLPLFSRAVLRLHPRHVGLANTIPDKPRTSPWILRRAELFSWVTDLRHGMRTLPAIPRFVIGLCDGKHTKAQMLKKLKDEHRLGRLTLKGDPQEELDQALHGLLERALLLPD